MLLWGEDVMARTFISTLGFTESLVLAPIIRLGLNRDDRVIILVPGGLGGEDRTENTLRKLRDMLNAISGGAFDMQTVSIPVDDFAEAVRMIRRIIIEEAERENRMVYVNVSGGMRALVIEAYTATLIARIMRRNVAFTELELEGSAGSIKMIPITFPKRFAETKRRILKELAEKGAPMGMRELSKRTGLSLPTLSRNLREMVQDNLIKLKKEGRRILAEITKEGKILT
ncbi:MAG TPA: CRISPR locus-related DNA-binding protein [Candidatus Bathyarchaeota archaeon]|nr:CRISPR locus-related DNA-binding protein [Candidatus Bathyarchaeota archaeon]